MPGMIEISGGTSRLGSDAHYNEEGLVHAVFVDAFFIDIHPVTNKEFAEFVAATGYSTIAERPLDPADFPGAPVENLVPGSMVFVPTDGPVDLRHLSQWWAWTPGASWRYPEGPGSSVADRSDHPVVHVGHADAQAYAAWAKKQLPTEGQWEVAARGGLDGMAFTWGDVEDSVGEPMANYYRGDFPWNPLPGSGSTTPVGTFPSNGFGCFDMAGNVWEWTDDWYSSRRHEEVTATCCVPRNPRGAPISESYDSGQSQFAIPRKVIKGGSFLCADSYCRRYRPAARRPQAIDTGMSHIGFRCVSQVAPS
jgi:formylglycine-generating enzyme required for sulfatase activity